MRQRRSHLDPDPDFSFGWWLLGFIVAILVVAFWIIVAIVAWHFLMKVW